MMCLPLKPFKVEREWEHAGLKCTVVLAREGGHRCGYVRVGASHPAFGKDYNDVDVDVHGGLTFGAVEPCAHENGTGYWFGFDCAHCGDSFYAPVFDESWGKEAKTSWLHHKKFSDEWREKHGTSVADTEHWWTEDEVVAETERLAVQLAAMR